MRKWATTGVANCSKLRGSAGRWARAWGVARERGALGEGGCSARLPPLPAHRSRSRSIMRASQEADMDRTDARTELDEAGREAVELARRWVAESADQPIEYDARLLSRVLKDPKGLEFTGRFVDGVIRPQDLGVAARTLARLARRDTSFLPPYLAAGVKAAGPAAVAAPEVVVPAARRVFRQLVGDLIVNTTGEGLATALAQARADGNRVNVNLLGEAVLGDGETARRLAANARLLARDDVDYLSLKVSAVTGPHNPWGFDEVVEHAVEHLLPFYLDAASASTPKFVNLDMDC